MSFVENSIVGALLHHANAFPQKNVFTILEDGETIETNITYAELTANVIRLAALLNNKKNEGKNVLLIYQHPADFITAFLACQYAGVIPVPVPYAKGSKQLQRLTAIIRDADAVAVCCTDDTSDYLRKGLYENKEVSFIITDKLPAEHVEIENISCHEIAFLQYTSGSTGSPKGVIVTHQNLLHNQQLIRNAFHCNPDSIIFSWLPFHHDMGLIGNILHTIYVGCSCILMSPFQFIQKPARWLRAISTYKVTHSGAPNFAYDLCVNRIRPEELETLDLSAWQVAYNGSEPLRSDTLQRFSNYFGPGGFKPSAFYPCYGLAEATLIVAGCKEETALPVTVYIDKEGMVQEQYSTEYLPVVSSGGIVPGMQVVILHPEDGSLCKESEPGEICIAGDSVTQGYWNKDNDEFFSEWNNQSFLKTGDLGFLYKEMLFVNGRIKELLIIRGKNIYPYDIEHLVASGIAEIEPNGVAVFGITAEEEKCIIVAEVKRTHLTQINISATIDAIDKIIIEVSGIIPHDILLLTPMGIPRTTSGKLQRVKCREYYTTNAFSTIGSKAGLSKHIISNNELLRRVKESSNTETITVYLLDLIAAKSGRLQTDIPDSNTELTEIGLDSIRAMELINTINRDLELNLDVTKVFQHNTLSGLISSIENVLWLKSIHTSGEEIII